MTPWIEEPARASSVELAALPVVETGSPYFGPGTVVEVVGDPRDLPDQALHGPLPRPVLLAAAMDEIADEWMAAPWDWPRDVERTAVDVDGQRHVTMLIPVPW